MYAVLLYQLVLSLCLLSLVDSGGLKMWWRWKKIYSTKEVPCTKLVGSGNRKRGRPKLRWCDELEDDVARIYTYIYIYIYTIEFINPRSVKGQKDIKLAVIILQFTLKIQGEHKIFPWLQTFITRKLRGIQTYFFFQNVTQLKKFFYNTLVHFNVCSFCCNCSFLIINVCNRGKTLCPPCIIKQNYVYKH